MSEYKCTNQSRISKRIEELNDNNHDLIDADLDTISKAFDAILHYNDKDMTDSQRLALLEDLDMVKEHLEGLILNENENVNSKDE